MMNIAKIMSSLGRCGMRVAWLSPLALVSALGGCLTLHVASDEETASEPLAHIQGDYHLRAGAAVNVFLRSVDDQPLKFWQHAADVAAGEHRLLVDCTVVATDKLSRHELNVALDAGGRYRLTADATPQQGCTQINLESK